MNQKKQSTQQILENIKKEAKIEKIKTSEKLWEITKNHFSHELSKSEEKIYDNVYLMLFSRYIKGKGIEIDITNDYMEKVVLTIHEYNHFIESQSAAYSCNDEAVDDDVAKDINTLFKNIKEISAQNKASEILDDFEAIKKIDIYEKLFRKI